MPNAWDITAKGGAPNSGGCAAAPYGTADAQCKAVYTFLSKQSGYDPSNPKAANNSLSTYATNPIWQVVDGPWKLTQLRRLGQRDLRPQPDLLGPGQAEHQEVRRAALHLGLVRVQRPGRRQGHRGLPARPGHHQADHQPPQGRPEQPPADQLQAGAAVRLGHQLLPLQLQLQRGRRQRRAHLQASCTSARPSSTWSTSRCTTRRSTRATAWAPTVRSRVTPANAFVSQEVQDNPTVQPGEGGHPAQGSRLEGRARRHVHLYRRRAPPPTSAAPGSSRAPSWPSTSSTPPAWPRTTELMNAEKSSWAQAGINMSLSQASFNTVIGIAVPCTPGSKCCAGSWRTGVPAGSSRPTTTRLVSRSSRPVPASNSGSYSDPTNDANILATNTTQTPLTAYENYLAEQLPGHLPAQRR